MNARFAVLVLAACLAGHLSEAAPRFLEAEVRIETTFWGNEGVRESVETLRCATGTDRWMLATLGDKRQATAVLLEGATLKYRTQVLAPPTEDPELFARNHPDVMAELGKVREREQPFPGLSPLRPQRVADAPWSLGMKVCWLALCSGSFLRQPDRSLYPTSDIWKQQSSNHLVFKDRTLTFSDDLGLPTFIELAGPENEVWLQYAVGSATQVGGSSLPTTFHLIQYWRRGEGGMMVLMGIKGMVTSIREVERIDVPPARE